MLFAEGGGGRPGDTDGVSPTGLDCPAFNLFGRLAQQPLTTAQLGQALGLAELEHNPKSNRMRAVKKKK